MVNSRIMKILSILEKVFGVLTIFLLTTYLLKGNIEYLDILFHANRVEVLRDTLFVSLFLYLATWIFLKVLEKMNH